MNAANMQPFGTTANGEAVHRICLSDGNISCEVITYGAALRTLVVPDRDGKPVDVVLGYDTLEQYLNFSGCFGATVGRVANRLAEGTFSLNGKTYRLDRNKGKHHIHGGFLGFNRKVWDVEEATQTSVVMRLVSPDGDQGYPGTLKAKAEYTLREDALIIRYTAVSDQDTLCNLTNHSYFNLSGHDSGSAMEQTIQMFAGEYTPTDADSVPLGVVATVAGTPMDLQETKPIGAHIDEAYPQLQQAKGYDHNYVVAGKIGVLRPVACVESLVTGIAMQVETTAPGVQFYTANHLEEGRAGKGGCAYGPRHGFCLETQNYPDAIHHPNFPSPVLRGGAQYENKTVFRFSNSR